MKAKHVCIAVLAMLGSVAQAQQPARDWRALARNDLTAARQLIVDTHPGMLDQANPQFRDWTERGYREALSLLPRVISYDSALAAVRYYTTGFRDGHLIYSDNARGGSSVWLTGWNVQNINGRAVVIGTLPNWPVPQPSLGARLIGCDGRSVEEIIADDVAPFVDRRDLPAVQSSLVSSIHLLHLAGAELKRCEFQLGDGTRREFDVRYKAVSVQEMVALWPSSTPSAARRNGFGLRDGVLWIRVVNFQPDRKAAQELEVLLEQLRKLGGIARMVFDTRGNRGGDSSIGERIFEAATGGLDYDETGLEHLPRVHAQWRVSKIAIGRLNEGVAQMMRLYGADSDAMRRMSKLRDDMVAAAAAGRFWVEQDSGPRMTPAEVERRGGKLRRFKGPVALITDSNCASACLDFADQIKLVPGSIHLGQTTSADSVYIDTTFVTLPSGNGLVLPLKVWRNRLRGNNEPLVPDIVFDADIDDDVTVRRHTLSALGHVRPKN